MQKRQLILMIHSNAHKTIFVEGTKLHKLDFIQNPVIDEYDFSFHLPWFGILVSFEFPHTDAC